MTECNENQNVKQEDNNAGLNEKQEETTKIKLLLYICSTFCTLFKLLLSRDLHFFYHLQSRTLTNITILTLQDLVKFDINNKIL